MTPFSKGEVFSFQTLALRSVIFLCENIRFYWLRKGDMGGLGHSKINKKVSRDLAVEGLILKAMTGSSHVCSF